MKKSILVISICLSTITTYAQMKPELIAFDKYSQDVSMQISNSFDKKDYQAAANQISEWYVKFNPLTPQLKSDLRAYNYGMAYNMACVCSREEKIDSGIVWFERSLAAGYDDYAHTLVDNDLDNLRKNARFTTDLQKLREKRDYGYVLQNSGSYSMVTSQMPAFTYQSANDSNLVALKTKFNLDSVAGNGDEISKVKRLLYWAHNSVRHDGNSSNPPFRNAMDLIAVCQKENRGVNCRMMSTILRDAYQAEGFDTRIVTCLPKDTTDNDCHVITVVWLKTLNKWVWMDPTFNAYVSDDKGNLLNIQEVREKLVSGAPLVLNDNANWNNKEKETKAYYLGYYMSKNLFWLQCSAKSEWNIETYKQGNKPIDYINLYPGTYNTIHADKKTTGWSTTYATNNPNVFWQKPGDAVQ